MTLALVVATVLCFSGCGDGDNGVAVMTPVPVPTQTPLPQESCVASGGQVTTMTCNCTSTGDFPNLCALGACSCPPGQSRQIQSCDCGTGQCFDGHRCTTAH